MSINVAILLVIVVSSVTSLVSGFFVRRAQNAVFATFDRIEKKVEGRIRDLELLVKHCWISSSYPNCGYSQMTTEQRELFDKIIRKDYDSEK